MKSKLIKISRLFFFFSVILLSSCDFTTLLEPSYDEPVREFFKEYTENAAIEKVTLPAGLKNSSGIICVSSENDSLVSFYMRNPQKYTLSFDFDFNEDDVQVEAASTGFSFTQSDDKNGGTLTFNKDFLYSVDAGNLGGKNISGSISLTEPKSGRSFASYPISLHANTEPPAIQGAIFQRSSQSDDAKYIVCFFMPNMNDSSMALHTKDTHVIYVNDEKKYTKEGLIYSSGQKNESGDWEISDQATAFTTTKPEFYALTDDDSAFTFAPANCPAGYKTLYYITGWPVTTDTKTCTFTIEDDDGLKNTFVISNKASQLNPPTFSVESNTSYSADEETFLYTVKINHDGLCTDGTTSGSVTINYTVTETNGSLVFAGGTSATLTGSAEGSASLSLPKGEYEIRATASKNYYISSEQASVSGIKIKKPAIYYISESGVDSDSASGAKGEPYRTIQYALNVFRSGIDSGDYDSDGICNIYVMTDLTPPEDFDWSTNNNSFVEITSALSGATVNITGYGGSRTISAKNNGTAIRSLLKVAAGTVTVDEINFTGGYTNSPDKPIIALAGSATVSISNSKIYGNTLASDTDNVLSLIQSGGSLKMKNVVMSDNFQDVVSGVDPQHAPSFLAIHQTGGNVTLDDCSITSSGTGHGTYWTLISSSGGTLTMNGGSIKDNTSCSAVFENGADMTINNAVINNNGDEWGSIIFNYGTLTVNGGSITNNTGGYNGLITNSDTGNATFTGTVIKNNTLAENAGAGSGDDYYNCGAAFWNKGSLTLDGCTVSGNTINSVNGRGAGIYMQTETGLTLKGKNYIYDNYNKGFATPKRDDIYLPTGGTITVEGNISGSKIGVNVPWQPGETGAPRIGVPADFTSGYGTYNTALPGEIFIAENGYGIALSDSGETAFAVSGGGMYTALDYDVKMTTAASVKAILNKAKTVTVAVSGTRKESDEATTDLYYNNADGKFYTDSGLTAKAAGDNTVTFAAALYNGATKVSDCEVAAASETGKILVTVPALAFEDTYTIRVTSTFLGVTKDVNVEYVVRYAYTPDGAISAIQGMSGGSLNIAVAGTITSSQLSQIKDAINAAYSAYDTTRISLDLSGCTGLSGQFLSFNGCKGLSEIILPEGITSLGIQCFRECSNLTDVYLPASLSSMEDSAFLYCSAGLTVSKDSLYYMREGDALYSKDGKTLVMYCSKLEENSTFTVPARVEKIGAWAFGQAKIKTISFESNSIMKTVGQHAFDRCEQLISIEFPDSIETIGKCCFQYNPNLANVKLPASLTVVPESMFGYSAAFTSIVIPDGVTEIQYAAFWGISSLQTIVLPASLQTVVYGAFNYCSGLTTVNYKGSEEQKAAMTIETNQNTKLINATWNYNYAGN